MRIQIEYMPYSDVQHQAATLPDRWLGIVGFSQGFATSDLDTSLPINHLHAQVLAGKEAAVEVLLAGDCASGVSADPLVSGGKGAIHYRCSDTWLFGVIRIDEPSMSDRHEGMREQGSLLQQATQYAYQQIFALVDDLGYAHLYRFWNYMADINGSDGVLERYRQFNVGRQQAFESAGRGAGEHLPAACALGLSEGPLSIAFLAGKVAATAVDNPRQVCAYHYPDQYGPRTPSFSRGTLLTIAQQHSLFISGTASIVGHQTLHLDDVAAQTRETMVNMDAVIAEANRMLGKKVFDLDQTCFRVYIRRAGDLDVVRVALQGYLKRQVRAVFVQADICRQDLLVEIEATVQSVPEAMQTS